MKFIVVLVLFISLFVGCSRKGPHMPLPGLQKFSDQPISEEKPGGCKSGEETVGFLEDVKPLFQTYCSQCHSFGSLNWLDYNISKTKLVQFNNRIFIRKDMPMPGYAQPTAQELSVIKRWIEAGGPETRACTDGGTSQPPASPEPPQDPQPPVVEPEPPVSPPPEPPVTTVGFEEDIKPLFKTYCAQCHFYGNLNWLSYEVVSLKLPQIEDRLFVKKDMPLSDPKPTKEEYDLIKRWLELGGPKNR